MRDAAGRAGSVGVAMARRRLSLIDNPVAGGRPGGAPGARAWRRCSPPGRGLPVRAIAPTSLEHAAELAREPPSRRARSAVRWAATGWSAAWPARCGAPTGCSASSPAGAATTSRAVLGIPSDPGPACRARRGGEPRRSTSGEVDGRTFIGIASCGFDSDANRIANETPSWLGDLVYAYGALRALVAGSRRDFDGRARRGEIAALHRATASRRRTRGLRRRHVPRPRRGARRRLLDVVMTGTVHQAPLPRRAPEGVRRNPRQLVPRSDRATEVAVTADRPFTLYADGDPIGELPATVPPRHRAVRVLGPPMTPPRAVVWHDLECGSYRADLPLWRELAEAAGGPVLDVGAGTGRVALDLARRGHDVTALDLDPGLLAQLAVRGEGLPVRTAQADARDFDLGRRFALILVPDADDPDPRRQRRPRPLLALRPRPPRARRAARGGADRGARPLRGRRRDAPAGSRRRGATTAGSSPASPWRCATRTGTR